MRNHYAGCPLLCVLAALASGGCDRGPALPKAVPVGGTVTLDGKPLAGATIRFTPIENTRGTGAAAAPTRTASTRCLIAAATKERPWARTV